MSLIAWYPLNNSILNQGLGGSTYNLSICSSLATPTLTAAGKVTPYCFATNITSSNNNKASNYHSSSFTPADELSFCCWFKATNSSGGTQHILQIGGGDYRGASGTNDTPVGMGLRLSNLTICLNGNGYSYSTGKSISANVWYHCTIILKDNVYTVYLNGENIYQLKKTNPFSESGIVIGSLYAGSYYTFYGLINDVRYYDNAISVKEIKELAKGLCLHYRLSQGGANLFLNSSSKSFTYAGGSSYVDSNFTQETITPAVNSYYTISFDAKSSVAGKYLCTYLYNNNSGRQCDKVLVYINGSLCATTTSGDGYTGGISTSIEWAHYTIIRHFNSNATALTKQNVFRIMGNSSSFTVYIKNAKMEEGDIETSWIPNKADSLYSRLGLNKEHDCSGYQNNGTISGSLTYTTDTPKNQGSIKFPNGTDSIYFLKPIPSSPTNLSVAFWVKLNASDGAYTILACNYANPGSGFWISTNCEGSGLWYYSSGLYVRACSTLNYNTWYHACLTYNNGTWQWYLNGEAKTTSTSGTNRAPIFTNYLSIGNSYTGTSWNTKRYGNVSDFRMYATTLSATDVKELYNVSASVDSNNVIHCGELIEL